MEVKWELFRDCPRCRGRGVTRDSFHADPVRCYACDGRGTEITEEGVHLREFLKNFPLEEDDGK